MTVPCIALVGLPGSGKSTVGRRLAEQLGWSFHDTDLVIARRAGRPAGQLLEEIGEPAFRQLETEVVEDLLQGHRPVVMACGGGLFAHPDSERRLLESAWVVCLDAEDDVLTGRVGAAQDRPLIRDDPRGGMARLRALRAGAHARAHLRVDAAGEAADIARSLVGLGDSIRVGVGEPAYPVLVEPGAMDRLERHLPADCARVAVICDRNVSVLGRRLRSQLRRSGRHVELVLATGGEALKSWSIAGRMVERLAAAGIGRRDCVVAVGGGSVGDLAGFVAATLNRGVAWIGVPTTLLAMVDSAIGGKTGVNLNAGKNLAGAFWQPRAVLADPTLLDTLAPRELISGLGEVAKYAMIEPEGELFRLLDASLPRLLAHDVEALAATVERCAAIKAAVVTGDTREGGPRAVLNYGHTVAHALEALAGYGRLTHGEAVAAGMRVAGAISMAQTGCPPADIVWQDQLLDGIGLAPPPPQPIDGVLQRLGGDKKAVAGQARWVLLERRGRPRTGEIVPEALVRRSLTEVLRR